MILVQGPSGDQRQFRSSRELTEAIRRGELAPEARIYHRIAARWLPITVHPAFRRQITERLAERLPPLARTMWTFFAIDSPEQSPQDQAALQPAGPPTNGHHPEEKPTSAWRRVLGRAIRLNRGGKE